MQEYRDHTGKVLDLDNHETYSRTWFPKKYLDMDAHTLREEVVKEIGHSLYYMMCWAPYVEWEDQYERVLAFGKRFAKESRTEENWENIPWLRKQLFLILDETENQC